MGKSAEAFRTIGEVAEELAVPKHVLRFWEGRFPQIRPMKRGGGRRYYRPEDMELLRGIRALLHAEGYTIRGVQKILREQGVDQVKAAAHRVAERLAVESGGHAQKKRGRKPIAAAKPVIQPTSEPLPPVTEATPQPKPTTSVLTAIRELEIARAILLGQPITGANLAVEVKKVRAERP